MELRVASAILRICVSLLIVLPLTAWAAMALWFRLSTAGMRGIVAASVFIVLGLGSSAAFFTRHRMKGIACFALAFGGVLIWWSTIAPPAHGDWTPDVARQTTGTLHGDVLTLSDVRDFEWRSESDFTERWRVRSYDLSRLKTVDLFLSYWAGPQMAHLIMSFGFDGGEQLAWSVEVRHEKNGQYSPVADAFKTDTIVYLATSERDTVRLRTNVRGEDVRLYRLRMPPDEARALLRRYVEEANALTVKPEFYNSITTNCTTAVAKMVRAAGDSLPLDWRLVANGYLPGYLYDRGAVVTTIPLSQLTALARIDDRAKTADQSPDFSRLIRIGVPSPR
jgi:Domain of unknown function (DUF4105)